MMKVKFLLLAVLIAQVVVGQTFTATMVTPTVQVPAKGKKVTLNTTTTEMGVNTRAQKKPAVILPGVETQVYPNPAKGVVQYSFKSSGKGSVIISLQNAVGQEMLDLVESDFDEQPVNFSTDVSGYPSGLYVLTFKYTDAAGHWQQISKKLQVAN